MSAPSLLTLAPAEFPALRPLYRAAGRQPLLLQAVVEGQQQGHVFVANRLAPQSALVLNRCGFMSLLELRPDPDFDASLRALFEAWPASLPAYLLWYEPPQRWQRGLDASAIAGLRNRERVRFVYQPATDAIRPALPCPQGIELRALDRELLPQAQTLGLALESRFWASADDLLGQSFGVCAVREGEVLSICYAACLAGRAAEIDIITRPDSRQLGLAQRVAQGFIDECLVRRLTPAWDCFALNTASVRLAESLGFAQDRRYPFYSFNPPCLVVGEAAPACAGGASP